MAALHSFRLVRAGVVLTLGSLLGSSCIVDTTDLTFDDDEYNAALGTGGQSQNSGGIGGEAGGVSTGGIGGLGGMGTSSGGMGGGDALCEETTMQCNGKQVEICSGNQWLAIGGPCPNACVGGTCTGVCDPGTDECVSTIQTQHCSDVGEWEADFCEFACVGGTCGGVCRPGDRGCNGDTRTSCADDGEWVDDPTECPGTCEAGVCVGACTLGDTQCSGDAENPSQVTCDDNTWEESTVTPCDFICDEATGECGGVCEPFTKNCASGTTIQECGLDGEWGEATACQFVCVEGDEDACGGSCVPGTHMCSGTAIHTCNANGAWVEDTTCSGETPVCLEATPGQPACVECAPGAKMCSPTENSLLTCGSDGFWPREGSACPIKGEGSLCWKDSRGGAACIPVPDITCPAICLKGSCPMGCIDSGRRWGCVSGKVTASDCTLGETCDSGMCN